METPYLKNGPVVFITTSCSLITFSSLSISETSRPMPTKLSSKLLANSTALFSFKSAMVTFDIF